MALHVNDTVSVKNENGERNFYRVQKLDKGGQQIKITLHTDAHKATEIPRSKTIRKAVSILMSDEYDLKKHNINAIGIEYDDKTRD